MNFNINHKSGRLKQLFTFFGDFSSGCSLCSKFYQLKPAGHFDRK
ncbi:hypothetical protein RU95_GL003608 [Enterococcus avium]|nr:hypothetical protein RU95_GL003608 [Enterococcus avium]